MVGSTRTAMCGIRLRAGYSCEPQRYRPEVLVLGQRRTTTASRVKPPPCDSADRALCRRAPATTPVPAHLVIHTAGIATTGGVRSSPAQIVAAVCAAKGGRAGVVADVWPLPPGMRTWPVVVGGRGCGVGHGQPATRHQTGCSMVAAQVRSGGLHAHDSMGIVDRTYGCVEAPRIHPVAALRS